MRRFTKITTGTLVLVFCLAALPAVSTAQVSNIDSHGRSITTVPPSTAGPSANVVNPATTIPEGTTVVYSNFGSGDSFNCCAGWSESGPDSGITGFIAAMAFRPAKATYILTQLDLALVYLVGTNGVTVEFCADDDGVPGRVIDSWYLTGLPAAGSTSNVVQTIKVKKTILLVQNYQYWLVPIPNSDEWAGWAFNTVGASGYGAESINGGVTWDSGEYSPNGAFDILGTVLPQPPGT